MQFYNKNIEDIFDELNTSESGLSSKEAEIKAVNTMKKDELLTKAAGMGLEVNDDDKVETLKEKIIAELSK